MALNLKHILASLQDGGGWDKKVIQKFKSLLKMLKITKLQIMFIHDCLLGQIRAKALKKSLVSMFAGKKM
jgi:hypothetical protein